MQRVYIFFPRFRLMRIQVVRGFTKTFYRKTLKILNKGSFILKQVETTLTTFSASTHKTLDHNQYLCTQLKSSILRGKTGILLSCMF